MVMVFLIQLVVDYYKHSVFVRGDKSNKSVSIKNLVHVK